MPRPTRTPQATPQERQQIEALLDRLFDAVACREALAPGEVLTLDGVEFDRATLDRLAGYSREHLRQVGCEASALRRQILFTEYPDDAP